MILTCDRKGRIDGEIEKMQCHIDGILHKAFSVFVFDGDKMLIQRRALCKYHSPGLWSNACCSHYVPEISDPIQLISTRFKEELGCDCKNLEHLFNFSYKTKFKKDLYEHEYDTVYYAELDGEIKFNPEEIDSIRWVKIDDLIKEVKTNPENFSYWFKKCYKKAIRCYKKMR